MKAETATQVTLITAILLALEQEQKRMQTREQVGFARAIGVVKRFVAEDLK